MADEIEAVEITDPAQLEHLLANLPPGSQVSATIEKIRTGEDRPYETVVIDHEDNLTVITHEEAG